METEKTESKFASFVEKNRKTIRKVAMITGTVSIALVAATVAYNIAKNENEVLVELLVDEDYTPSITESVESPTE